jgi:hypothetical protein
MAKIKLKKSELKKLIEGFFYKEQSVNEVAGMGMTVLGQYEGFAYKILSSYNSAKKDAGLKGSDKYFHYLAFYDSSNFGIDKYSLTFAGLAKEFTDFINPFGGSAEAEDMATNKKGIKDGAEGIDPSIYAQTLMPKTTPGMMKLLESDDYSWVFDTPGFSDFYKRDTTQMPRAIQPRYNIMLSPELRRQAWEKRGGVPSYVNNMSSLSAK